VEAVLTAELESMESMESIGINSDWVKQRKQHSPAKGPAWAPVDARAVGGAQIPVQWAGSASAPAHVL
jgi:hypothetical protein